MSEPATKDDLKKSTTQLRGEMKEMGEQLRGEMKEMGEQLRGEMKEMGTQLRSEMADMEGRLRGEMRDMEDRLGRKIDQSTAQVANVMVEQFQPLLMVFDEKYKDFPGRHQELRDDFDAHATDFRLHTRLPPAPAKRARRPRTP